MYLRIVAVSIVMLTITTVPQLAIAQPIADSVYLQEVGSTIPSKTPLVSVASARGKTYAAGQSALYIVEGDALAQIDAPTAPLMRLESFNDTLFAITGTGLYKLDGTVWKQIAPGVFVDMCLHLDAIHAATSDELFKLDGDTLTPVPGSNTRQPVQAIASYSGTLYVLHPGGIAILDSARGGYDRDDNVFDWGEPLPRTTRDLLAMGSRLYVATDQGLGLLRGMALTAIRGEDGLPYEDAVCLREGFGGDLWIGTTRGAIRRTGNEYHYFNAGRWLPNEKVNDIAVDNSVAYIATDGGLGIVRYEPFTLQKKAAYYERWLDEWGQKRLGFTHKLEWNAQDNQWVREVSDNDVGWSTHYLAAMCFKYAVTKEQHARDEAVDFLKSVLWSEEISGIPGFPARSVWAVGERGHQAQHGSGGLPAEWHDTPDGKWQWKGDTSSDETDAHFYAVPIFIELVANEKEKARSIEHLRRIAAHIVDHGWTLHDVDGKPTRWARWDPEYLHTKLGFYAQGLNGLESLAYMQTTYALTKDTKFSDAYKALLDLGYHNAVLRTKLTFPPGFIFHSDDRLAFYAYYSMLKYETDPTMRSIYLRSLERSWEVERIEHNPWFNFIYGALTGNDCEAAQAVTHLREWPLDMVDYSYRNSHRADLQTPKGYVPYSGGTRSLSPRERGPMRWSDNGMQLDGGGGGMQVVDPSGWLDAYWMGRYYGYILPPDAKDQDLISVPQRNERHGAAPYDGPRRPPLKDEI
ncbi:MAG: hypothetical protein HUU46_12360 [Candidatus Hydrogenedentes bacterium]|nr:hypothetical protein [Candidatus Hydrogenedentota bacterium]